MKVYVSADEWYPMADLDTDENLIKRILKVPEDPKKRKGFLGIYTFGREMILDITKEEYDEYKALMERLCEMSQSFLDRCDDQRAAICEKYKSKQ